MSSNLYFSKKMKNLNDKITSCVDDISNLFDGIENLDKVSKISISDEAFGGDLFSVFENLSILLENSPNLSEFIFPHLEEIRKQNTLTLFESSLIPEEDAKPDEPSQNIELLWEKICLSLELNAVKFLKENYRFSITSPSLHDHFNVSLLKSFILRLQCIYTLNIVWEKYKDFRRHCLDAYYCPCNVPSGSCFFCFLHMCLQCIYEDKFLLNIGCFHTHILTQSGILESYTDFLNKKFHGLLKTVAECCTMRRTLSCELKSILSPSDFQGSMSQQACWNCFVRKRLGLEVNSAVYCVENCYGTESVWNVIFNGLVINTIQVLLSFEDQILSILHKKQILHHSHFNNLPTLIEGTKLVLASDSPKLSPFSKASQQKSAKKNLSLIEGEKIHLIWNWRSILVENGYLSNLQRLLQIDIEQTVKTSIEREKKALKCKQWRELLSSDKEIIFASESIQTNSILRSVYSTVQTLEKYLPVLETSCESFASFKSSFYHALETYVINLVKHLRDIAEHVKDNALVFFEYIALNNAIFLRDRLHFYCELLQVSVSETSPNNIYHSVNQMTNDLKQSVHLHLFRFVSCGILFDAQSHDFGDQKPFYEGERVSFSIQSWNLFMQGLLHDLKYFLPQKIAQEIYAEILSSSVEFFLSRYSHCCPSEARTPQILSDIYAILLSTSELLWPACASVAQFIGRKQEMDEGLIASAISNIHSSCCLLLAVAVVLTAPLNDLHRSFKDGFPQARLSLRTKYELVAPWLPWIRRELFSEFSERQIVSNVSVWLAVRLGTVWSVPDPVCVVKAFTEHNCTLSIMLMMQAATSSMSSDQNPFASCISEASKVRLCFYLVELLICFGCHSHLQDILLPVIEKTNGWQEFDKSNICKSLDERSWWYKGLFRSLRPFMNSVFEEMMPIWIDISKKWSSCNELKLNELKNQLKDHVVCVCPKEEFNFLRDDLVISDEIISFICLRKLFESLLKNLILLPQSLKCFLLSLDLHVANYVPEVQAVQQSLPLQVLLSYTFAYLQDLMVRNRLSTEIQQIVTITADMLGRSDDFLIDDDCPKIIPHLMSSIRGKFNDMKKDLERLSENMNTKEIKDEILDVTVSKLLKLQHGKSIILYLHSILCRNVSWIQRSLGVSGMLSSDLVLNLQSPSPLPTEKQMPDPSEIKQVTTEKPTSSFQTYGKSYTNPAFEYSRNDSILSEGNRGTVKPFTDFTSCDLKEKVPILCLDVEDAISPSQFNFNPLELYDKLGESSYTKVISFGSSWLEWQSVLSHLPVFGLTETNFSELLSRRWDMRNGGPTLSQDEVRIVEELKAVYKLEP